MTKGPGPCFLCGADHWRVVGNRAGRGLMKCRQCRLHLIHPPPGPGRDGSNRSGIASSPDDASSPAGAGTDLDRALARGRIDFIGQYHPGGRLLAIGPGAVTLAEAAQEAGFGASTWVRGAGEGPSGFGDLGSFLRENSGRFDTVLLVDVIETLVDPVGDLAGLPAALAPGGQVFVETLTVNSPAFAARPALWWARRAPGAAALYDEQTLTALLARLGLPLRRLAYPSLPERLLAVAGAEPGARQGPKRILLQRFIALGDVILTTPIIRALKQNEPGWEVWVQTAQPEVLAHNPWVSGVISAPEYQCFDARIELAYEYTPQLHAVEAYARQAGVEPDSRRPELFVSEAELADARAILAEAGLTSGGPLIGLHASTSWPERTWPAERWDALAWELVVIRGCRVAVLGQPADGEVAPLPGAVDLRGRLGLRRLMAVISGLDGLIGADSGLLHVASAVGTPFVGLFGCVPSAKRMPDQGNFVALEADLPCADCLARRPAPAFEARCERDRVACMAAIEVEAVWSALGRVLSQAGQTLPPARSAADVDAWGRAVVADVLARNQGRLELRPTVAGGPGLRVRRPDGGWQTLHSGRDPVREAQGWAERAELEPGRLHLVLGAGLGFHLEALAARATADESFLVLEPDRDVFWLGLFAGRLGHLLGRLAFHVSNDVKAAAIKYEALARQVEPGPILVHSASARLHPALFRVMSERVLPLVARAKKS
ncbi:MAG: methyltransferase domain-containing protein [Proteobacteria bacterium]|nr:methyltransferase domain-containing protein [Pseudomonadota bacterium]